MYKKYILLFILFMSIPLNLSWGMLPNEMEDKYVTIRCKESGKSLDSWDADTDKVGKAESHYNGHQYYEKQLWKIHRENPGESPAFYKIRCKETGKALDSWHWETDFVGKAESHDTGHEFYEKQLWMIDKG